MAEVDAFKRWRVIGLNLLRRRPVWCIEAETFDDNDRARIMCYTGFVYKYKTQQAGQPSLQWYTQLPWLMEFVSFLIGERGAGQAYVRTHLNTAIYVLDFLSICKAKGDEQQQAQRLIEALTLLLTQACMPSKLLLKCLLCFVSQTVPGCKFKGCVGNITFWMDAEQTRLAFRITHHKSQWSWHQPIEGEFPSDLTQQFFVNRNGAPFTAAGLTVYYSNMLHQRLRLEQHITPHRVRHILVSFVQQNPKAFNGVRDQIATLMGHALRQWQEVYDLAVNRRSVAGAFDAMAKMEVVLRRDMVGAEQAGNRAPALALMPGPASPGFVLTTPEPVHRPSPPVPPSLSGGKRLRLEDEAEGIEFVVEALCDTAEPGPDEEQDDDDSEWGDPDFAIDLTWEVNWGDEDDAYEEEDENRVL
ncbi:hypothetical protein ACK3TF_006203 [Chlorella vulgaris]